MKLVTVSALAIGASLLAGSGEARTSGPVCKAECAPRVQEQCGALRGKPRRVCRRQLVQGCKRTTPLVACTTTSDMTLALADRSFAIAPASGGGFVSSRDLTLCGDGRFTFGASAGTWEVTITSGGLTLNLRAAGAGTGGITDGTSNTILVGEAQQFQVARADEDAVLFDGRSVEGDDAGLACGGGGRRGGDTGGTGPSASGVDLDALTRALGNKSLRLQTGEVFSSGSISTERTLDLCSSGSVLLVETTVTSSSIGDISNTFDSTKQFDGTWKVLLVDGVPTLELDVGESEPRRFAVVVDGGAIFLDGTQADVSDATTCGVGTPGGTGDTGGTGGTDPGPSLTDALAGHALITIEDNVGFGRRTTIIVLCASGRYAMEITVSAAPGRVQDSTGTWSAEVGGGGPILTLNDDGGGPTQQLAIGEDSAGGLLLDGLTVREGDPSAVPGICAAL